MIYPRIFNALRTARWASAPATVHSVFQVLATVASGGFVPQNGFQPDSPPKATQASGVTVIPIHGIIGKNLSALETECGGIDVNTVKDFVGKALEDDGCECIVLDFDSPGGIVTGVPELAAFIREAGEQKPIYAFTSGEMCSAAYWLASSTQGIFCTQTADVGSIGVYVALVDESEAWAQAGYKLELMKAGTFKGAGIPGLPLADDARAMIQADVDKVYAMFTADVLKGRPNMQSEAMQGQTFMGDDAVATGLVDGMVDGIGALLAQLATTTA